MGDPSDTLGTPGTTLPQQEESAWGPGIWQDRPIPDVQLVLQEQREGAPLHASLPWPVSMCPSSPEAPKHHDYSRGWKVMLREGWSHSIRDNCYLCPLWLQDDSPRDPLTLDTGPSTFKAFLNGGSGVHMGTNILAKPLHALSSSAPALGPLTIPTHPLRSLQTPGIKHLWNLK